MDPNDVAVHSLLPAYVKAASDLAGPRRALTEQEEADLAQADKLLAKARRLSKRARKMKKRAAKLRPDNLYPNSLLGKYIMATRLPAGVGIKLSIPRFTQTSASLWGPQPAPDPDANPEK